MTTSSATREPSNEMPDDPVVWEHSRAFLKISIVVILAGGAAFDALLFILSPDQTSRALAVLTLMAAAVWAWFLLSRGKLKAAIGTLGAGVWVYITVVSFFFGGVSGSSIIIYPLIILLTGWLVGARAAVAVALLTTATTLAFVLGETWGLLPAAPATHPTMRWVVEGCVFMVTAALIYHVVRSYRNRIAEVRKLGVDLAQRAAELQRIEADLNRAQAVGRIGSWIYDLPNDKMILSAETCRIFGLRKRRTGSYHSYRSRVHPEDRDAVERAWQAAIAGAAHFDNEHRIVIGRKIRWVRQIAEFEFDANGVAQRAVGTTQEITERKQAEAAREQLEMQLRESQKMEALGTLAGGIAHDFNNVLAVIAGNLELARRDLSPGHPAKQSLQEIAKATSRAKALVRQILAFGRRQVFERKAMSLAPLVEETARLLLATQPAAMEMSVECAPDTPWVMVDPNQIEQVLVNLCTNAWHAVEEQGRSGRIEIRLAAYTHASGARGGPATFAFGNLRAGRYACLTVRDNGKGMDHATQRRMFEPFFTTKAVGKGVGLGLAVVHGIIEGHDACMEVDSAIGGGSAFRIYFPAIDAVPVDAQDEVKCETRNDGAVHAAGDGKHVLYLDDDEALVYLVTRILEQQGYRVSGYTRARDAVAAVRANPGEFDLVVTDYNMPGTSGLIVTQELKTVRDNLPVALTSGYLTEEIRVQALEAGVRELIYKPNTVEELCDAVLRLLEQKTLPGQ